MSNELVTKLNHFVTRFNESIDLVNKKNNYWNTFGTLPDGWLSTYNGKLPLDRLYIKYFIKDSEVSKDSGIQFNANVVILAEGVDGTLFDVSYDVVGYFRPFYTSDFMNFEDAISKGLDELQDPENTNDLQNALFGIIPDDRFVMEALINLTDHVNQTIRNRSELESA